MFFFLRVLQVVKLGWIFFLVVSACRTLADLIHQCVWFTTIWGLWNQSLMSWNTLIRCKPSVFKNCWVDSFFLLQSFFKISASSGGWVFSRSRDSNTHFNVWLSCHKQFWSRVKGWRDTSLSLFIQACMSLSAFLDIGCQNNFDIQFEGANNKLTFKWK